MMTDGAFESLPAVARSGVQTNKPQSEAIAGNLDWDTPDDPDNPRNWPSWQRILHSAVPAFWSFGLYVMAHIRPDPADPAS